jgi:hypothetical protein
VDKIAGLVKVFEAVAKVPELLGGVAAAEKWQSI